MEVMLYLITIILFNMMNYTAPDGYVIHSEPYPKSVEYICHCEGVPDGKYHSVETTSSDTEIGIQQIKIVRVVSKNKMHITITMSSDQELLDYINHNKNSQ